MRADLERVLTAHHEAGHAVAAYVFLGWSSVVRVAMDPIDKPDLAGVCTIARVNPRDVACGWQALAGPVAQQIAAEMNGLRRPPVDRYDQAKARVAFGHVERWRIPAMRDWLRSPDVWQHVEKLARGLLRRGPHCVLDGAEVSEMLSSMDYWRAVEIARVLRIIPSTISGVR